jgi:signal peptidase II
MSWKGRAWGACLLGLVVILLDQLSKWYTAQFIPLIDSYDLTYPYNGIGLFENFLGIEFSISHVDNRGAAWGLFSSHQALLVFVRIGVILGLIGYTCFSEKARPYWFPLSLTIAGAISNVIDYFTYGYVVDMLHTVLWGYDFPVFNIADSAVFLGVSWMTLSSFYLTRYEHSSV